MNKRLIILPVITIICLFASVAGAYSPKTQSYFDSPALQALEAEVIRVENLPSGSPFSIVFTDKQLTDAAKEGLEQNKEEVKALIKLYFNTDANVSDPKIEFRQDQFKASLKVGVSFLKVGASASGKIGLLNGLPDLNIEKIDLPLVKIDPDTVNSQVKIYIDAYGYLLAEYITISNIAVTDGQILIEGTRK